MSLVAEPTESRWRLLGVGLLVFVVQAAAAYFCWLWVVLGALSVAGCGDNCNYELGGSAVQTQRWVGVVSLIVAFVALVLLAFRGRQAWWVPAIGLGIILVTTICTTIAVSVGTQHPDALGALMSLMT